MVDEERGAIRGKETCDAVEGGYTIFLDGAAIAGFMESGDFSSARELDHFKEVAAKLESRIEESTGLSLLALSVTENRIARDFAVLQIAHVLAKHGKNILVVDCDFLHPGLSGLVEGIDELGFLDLLLYGSSIKSISSSIGIYDVSVTGPGSFPVSKALPFALKEFGKAKEFLSRGRDVVIYCATLYVEKNAVSPLCNLVDGIILSCQIEEMGEGQLQRNLKDLGSGVPPVDLVCFCGRKEGVVAGREKPVEAIDKAQATAGKGEGVEEDLEPVTIEKMEEVDAGDRPPRGRSRLPRIITIAAAIILVTFIVWWVLMNRTIREKEATQKMTELVQKQRDARKAVEGKPVAEEPVEEDVEGTAVTGGAGTEEASRQVPPPEENEAETVTGEKETAPPAGEYFTIHVASFRDIARAEREAAFLKGKGFDAKIVEFEIRSQTWFRILVGEFDTKEGAAEFIDELRPINRSEHSRIIKQKRD